MSTIPTKSEFAEAFRHIQITDLQRRMLTLHYHATDRVLTAGQMAEAFGFQDYRNANSVYGKLGKKLAVALDWNPPESDLGVAILTTFTKPDAHWRWHMRPQVAKALEELTWSSIADENAFQETLDCAVSTSQQDSGTTRRHRLSLAPTRPQTVQVLRSEFQRNPDVIAEVLVRADGHCECCGACAPFARSSDGSPYLEVHHVRTLADGGEDTIENAVALCPNCHRKKHFG